MPFSPLTIMTYHRHSDIIGEPVVADDMLTLGGQDLTDYFPMYVCRQAHPLAMIDEIYCSVPLLRLALR